MNTRKAPSSTTRRSHRSIVPSLLFGSLLASLLASGSLAGCSHAWEDYDPRLAGAGAGDPTGGSGGMGTGGMGTGGMGTGGSGGVMAKCGGTSAFVSDFSGNGISGLWDDGSWGGADITESGGELVIKLPSNSMGGFAAYVNSEYYYDFQGDFASIELTQATNPSASVWAFFSVGPNSDNYIEIFQEGPNLIAGQELDGNYTKHKTAPYDAMAHRFWRLRETDGRAYFETSPDEQQWTVFTDISTAGLFPLDYVRITVGAGSDNPEMNPGEAHFDRLNGGGTPKQKYCPMSSITDDFNDGAEHPRWGRSWEDNSGMLDESGGEFVFHYAENAEAWAQLVSARAFELTDSSVTLEVPEAPSTSATAYFGIEASDTFSNEVEMFVKDGQLEFGVEVEGNYQKLGGLEYSPTEHRWWRVRHASNALHWETAPDGKTWTTRLQVGPAPVPTDVMDLVVFGGTWMPMMMPGVSRADNLNLPP